tara:strand:- start:267 stop:440 length:174 start_codon:yes stop_codon:yes gene_type:complete
MGGMEGGVNVCPAGRTLAAGIGGKPPIGCIGAGIPGIGGGVVNPVLTATMRKFSYQT